MATLKLMWTFVRFVVAWAFTLWVSATTCLLCVVIGPSRAWLLMARWWARTTLRLVGVRLRVQGAEHLAAGPAIFICNHRSLIDVVFMPALLPRTVRFVAKRELLYIPLWGWAFAAGGAVLIDRARPRQALRNLYRGLRRLPRGWSLVVFPEGTRPADDTMLPFKKGAFHMAVYTGLPLVPVGLDGARAIVPPDGWLVRAGEVRVHVGPPISTQGWQIDETPAHVRAGAAAVAACVEQARAMRTEPDRCDATAGANTSTAAC